MSDKRWNDSQLIEVTLALQRDKGFVSNVDIICPICGEESLSYDRTGMFDVKCWCTTCETGLKQGE